MISLKTVISEQIVITSKHADCIPQYQGFGALQVACFQLYTDTEFPC